MQSGVELAGAGENGKAEGESPVVTRKRRIRKRLLRPMSQECATKMLEWKHGRLQREREMFAGPEENTG